MTIRLVFHEHHSALTSTQDEIRHYWNRLKVGECGAVSADFQSQGRGTHGRVWQAPTQKNILISYGCLLESSVLPKMRFLPLVMASALCALLKEYGLEAQIKWVNDVLIHHRKIAGVLCESEQFSQMLRVIIGIGLNVHMDEHECALIETPSTSLSIQLGTSLDRPLVIERLHFHVLRHLNHLLADGFEPYLSFIQQHLAFKNEKVRFQSYDTGAIEDGTLIGINDQGALILENAQSQQRVFVSGRLLWH